MLSRAHVDIIKVSDQDASFILGCGGRTKKKLARVCQADLNITKDESGSTILEVRLVVV